MSVKDWISGATKVETYEPFEDRLKAGTLIGSPTWTNGVDGRALSCGADQGAVIPTTEETARGYPMSVSCWFMLSSVAATTPVFQWGSQPSVGAQVFGSNSTSAAGTLEAHVRMSNGRYALRVRSGALATNRWHALTITVAQTTIWGGCRTAAYVNGEQIGAGSYSGSLFDIVNFDRPRSVTLGAGNGPIVLDEFVTQETTLTPTGARHFYESAESIAGMANSGWGVIWG